MKKIATTLAGSLLLLIHCSGLCSNGAKPSVFCQATQETYQIAGEWAGVYGSLHPGVNMDVVRVKESPGKDFALNGTDLYIVSDRTISSVEDGAWKMMIGREAIVPVIQAGNPFLGSIRGKGITQEELAILLTVPGKQKWGTLLGNGISAPAAIYLVSNGSVRLRLAEFLGTDPGSLRVIPVATGAEMLAAIRRDPNAIGFCPLTDVISRESRELTGQVLILPIDKNRNGKLDGFENIYGDLASFTRGVWIGKYPAGLTRTIYAVSSVRPSREEDISFLKWILTGGQQMLDPAGYRDIAFSDRQTRRLATLSSAPPALEVLTTSGFFAGKLHGLSVFSFVVVALIPLILAFMIYQAAARHRKERQAAVKGGTSVVPVGFNENSLDAPGGLYFDKTHTWAFREKNGSVRIGIDDFLRHVTGPFTRIRMKDAGETVRKGEPLLSVMQNGKQLTIHSPVSGTIRCCNSLLETNPSLIDASPYADGWIYVIEPANWAREIRYLFMAEQYTEWLKKEFSRLKEFLAATLKGSSLEISHVILQDGGEVKETVLTDLGPELWEEFQIRFLDENR